MKINRVLTYYYKAYNKTARGKETARVSINAFKGVIGAEKRQDFYLRLKKILFHLFCGPLYWPNTFPTGIDEATAEFLYSIARLTRPEVAVEIGTANGNASIAIGQALEDNKRGVLYTFDPQEQELVHIAIKKSGLKNRIKYIIGYSTNALPKLNFSKLDFVFIDGDHSYENVKKDFDLVKDLIPMGGIVVFHDTTLLSSDGPKRVVEQILNESDFDVLRLPTLGGTDKYQTPTLFLSNEIGINSVGITVCRKKIKKDFKSLICPICSFWGIFERKEVFNSFKLYKCSNCSISFWWPLKYPGKDFYEESYMFDIIEERKPAWYHKQFLKKPPIGGGNLIDVGCGQGEFLEAVSRRKNFNFWGIDIAKKNIDFIKQTYGLDKVYNETLENFCKRKDIPKFDVVTLFEVLEHLVNPNEFLDEIKKITKPGGYLVLSTPNSDRFGGTKEDWDYPPNHIFHWNKKSISSFLLSHGFEIESITEQPFSKDFFVIRGILSLGIMGRLRRRIGVVAPQRGGEAVSINIKKKPILFHIVRLLATLKNLLLFPFLSVISLFLRILGLKYWDMYVIAKLK